MDGVSGVEGSPRKFLFPAFTSSDETGAQPWTLALLVGTLALFLNPTRLSPFVTLLFVQCLTKTRPLSSRPLWYFGGMTLNHNLTLSKLSLLISHTHPRGQLWEWHRVPGKGVSWRSDKDWLEMGHSPFHSSFVTLGTSPYLSETLVHAWESGG